MAWLELRLPRILSARGARLDLDDRLVLPDEDGRSLAIGRMVRDDCDFITLWDPTVSRRHCRIERREGMWRVVDDQSASGLLLDGVRVRQADLADGAILRIGWIELRFFEPPPPRPLAVCALAAGRLEEALCALLEAWRRLPTARRGDWIEALGEAVVDEAIVEAAAAHDVWMRLARDPLPSDVSALLCTALLADPSQRAERLAAIAGWPKDPRIARWLLAEPPPPDDAWTAALRAHVSDADLPLLSALPTDLRERVRQGNVLPWTDAPFVEEDFDAFWIWLVPPPSPDPLRDSLLAEIYQRPDEDGPRGVLADWLQQRGDPHGEFVALSLLDHPSPAQRARAASLRRAHQLAWLGELAEAVDVASVRWVRGFPEQCTLRPGARPTDAPAWRTVKHRTAHPSGRER